MSTLESRMKKLERLRGAALRPVTALSIQFVGPDAEEPVDGDLGIIFVIRGGQFNRCDYETSEAFYADVNACHERLYGEPFLSEDAQ
ncbi:MAG: hypothetical protein AAGK02_02650 [Pseudomonadota bacterium]